MFSPHRFLLVPAVVACLAWSAPSGADDFPGNTDAGLNLLLGAGMTRGSVLPYFQAKVIAKDDSELSLALGLRF